MLNESLSSKVPKLFMACFFHRVNTTHTVLRKCRLSVTSNCGRVVKFFLNNLSKSDLTETINKTMNDDQTLVRSHFFVYVRIIFLIK